MKVYSTSFTLSTYERTEVSDITKLVRDAVQQFAVTTGIALINTLHTTCAVFINEFQSALIDDLKGLMEGLVPERGGYRHDDPRGNQHQEQLAPQRILVEPADGNPAGDGVEHQPGRQPHRDAGRKRHEQKWNHGQEKDGVPVVPNDPVVDEDGCLPFGHAHVFVSVRTRRRRSAASLPLHAQCSRYLPVSST